MSAEWDYATLAKTASQYGGPEQYLQILKNGARQDGMKSGFAWCLGLCATAAGVYKYYSIYSSKRKNLTEMAEAELLEGLRSASVSPEAHSADS